MAYSVYFDQEVIDFMNDLERYCIIHYGNYTFGRKFYREVDKIVETIKYNPRAYIEIKNHRHRVIILKRYRLFYQVYESEKEIYIYRICSCRQNF